MGKLLFMVIVLVGALVAAWNIIRKDPILRAELEGGELDDVEELLDEVEDNKSKAAKISERLNNQQTKGGNDDPMDPQPTAES